MSKNADAPAVDLDRMTVPQLTALIAAAEAKRRDKLEDARNDKWPRKRHLSVSHGDISSGEAEAFQNYVGYKTTNDSNSGPPALTVSRAHTDTEKDGIHPFVPIFSIMAVVFLIVILFAGGR